MAKSNPVRRRRRETTRAVAAPAMPRHRRARRARVSRRVRRYVQRVSTSRGLMPLLMDSAQGAVGAVTVNAAFNFLPLPATMKSGMVGTLAKAGVAIGLGMLAPRNRMVANMVKGSLTVTLYDALKGMGIPGLAGLGYYQPAMAMPTVQRPALAEYVNGPGSFAAVADVSEYVGNDY